MNFLTSLFKLFTSLSIVRRIYIIGRWRNTLPNISWTFEEISLFEDFWENFSNIYATVQHTTHTHYILWVRVYMFVHWVYFWRPVFILFLRFYKNTAEENREVKLKNETMSSFGRSVSFKRLFYNIMICYGETIRCEINIGRCWTGRSVCSYFTKFRPFTIEISPRARIQVVLTIKKQLDCLIYFPTSNCVW